MISFKDNGISDRRSAIAAAVRKCFTDVRGEWTLPIPRSQVGLAASSVTIDNHFRGFTPLNSIDDADYKVE